MVLSHTLHLLWYRTFSGTPSAVGDILFKILFFKYLHVAQAVIEDIFNHPVLCIGFLFIFQQHSNHVGDGYLFSISRIITAFMQREGGSSDY